MYDGRVGEASRRLAQDTCLHTTCPSERTRLTFARIPGQFCRSIRVSRERTRVYAHVFGTRRSNADHVPVVNVFIIFIPFVRRRIGWQEERPIPSGDVTPSLTLLPRLSDHTCRVQNPKTPRYRSQPMRFIARRTVTHPFEWPTGHEFCPVRMHTTPIVVITLYLWPENVVLCVWHATPD